jgi:Xaa-Pro aminopeptidase
MNHCRALQQNIRDSGADALLLSSPINRFYASGFRSTAGHILLTPEKAYYLTDSRYIEAAKKQCGSEFEIIEATRENTYIKQLTVLFKRNRIRKTGFEDEFITADQYMTWKKVLPVKLIAASHILDKARQMKNSDEINAILRAERIAEKALTETLPLLKNGLRESDIAAELTYRVMRGGASGTAFPPIAASGPNSSMPHSEPGDRIIESGDFVIVDFGCVAGGYCSDMTRTVAVGGVTDEMKNVYDIVLKAQMSGIAAARAGVAGGDIDAAARRIIDGAGYGDYFGHGFGHGIGLEVHEGLSASKGAKESLPSGSVISAEPGIYIPGRFGVRIEDMIVLTDDGNRNLTAMSKELLIL